MDKQPLDFFNRVEIHLLLSLRKGDKEGCSIEK